MWEDEFNFDDLKKEVNKKEGPDIQAWEKKSEYDKWADPDRNKDLFLYDGEEYTEEQEKHFMDNVKDISDEEYAR